MSFDKALRIQDAYVSFHSGHGLNQQVLCGTDPPPGFNYKTVNKWLPVRANKLPITERKINDIAEKDFTEDEFKKFLTYLKFIVDRSNFYFVDVEGNEVDITVHRELVLNENQKLNVVERERPISAVDAKGVEQTIEEFIILFPDGPNSNELGKLVLEQENASARYLSPGSAQWMYGTYEYSDVDIPTLEVDLDARIAIRLIDPRKDVSKGRFSEMAGTISKATHTKVLAVHKSAI